MEKLSTDLRRPVSVQLWSVREHLRADLQGTLQSIAEMGFVAVETARFEGFSAAELRAAIGAAGLGVSSAHGPIPVGNEADELIVERASFGTDLYICAGRAAPQFDDGKSLARYADQLNEAAANCRRHGMRFGYHNHWYEFGEIDGAIGYETLVSLLDPEVFLQVDTYWAQHGGVDPVALVSGLSERVHSLHLKDGPGGTSAKPTVVLGQGIVDNAGVVAAATHAKWHVVELHNNKLRSLEVLRGCIDYLIDSGLSVGSRQQS